MPCTPVRNNARGGTGPVLVPYSTRQNSAPSRRGTGANNDCGACAGVTPSADQLVAADLSAGLVDVWPCSESAGNLLGRAFGTRLVPSPSGVGGDAAGKFYRGASFDRSVPAYLVADHYLFNAPTFTVSFWVKFNLGTGSQIPISIGDPENHYVAFTGSALVADYYDAGGSYLTSISIPFVPVLGTWNFVVTWYDQTTQTGGLAVNGVEATAVLSSPRGANGNAAKFGRYASAAVHGLSGSLCEIAQWWRALSAAERAYLWNGGAGRSYPWPLGCAVGSAVNGACSGLESVDSEDWFPNFVCKSKSFSGASNGTTVALFITRVHHRADLGPDWWEYTWAAESIPRQSGVSGWASVTTSCTGTTPPHPYLFTNTGRWSANGVRLVNSATACFLTMVEEGGAGLDTRAFRFTPATRTIEQTL